MQVPVQLRAEALNFLNLLGPSLGSSLGSSLAVEH